MNQENSDTPDEKRSGVESQSHESQSRQAQPNQRELDELVLDRLVDNDLSDEEYRRVLRLVEEKPDGWRQLALAFLESQAFEKELSSLHQLSEGDSTDFSALPCDPQSQFEKSFSVTDGQSRQGSESVDKREFAQPYRTEPDGKPPSPKSVATPNPPNNSNLFWNNFRVAFPAIAACFVIAFIAGLYIRELQNRNQNSGVAELDKQNESNSIDPGFLEVASYNQEGSVKTPVYDHQKFDSRKMVNDFDQLKPKIRKVANQSGWHTNERSHVMPIRDKKGNKIILPLTEIEFSPSKFEDYQ